jgi:hypothetical protein
MSEAFSYKPSPDEEARLLPYITTVIVGCNDGTGLPRQYVLPTLTALWLYSVREALPLDVAFSLSGPQSLHLVRLINQLESSKIILRVCTACGQYTVKPSNNIPKDKYIPSLTIKAARMCEKIKTLFQGGKQWTSNLFCGIFCKGSGIQRVLEKQSEFAKIPLDENTVKQIVNSLYSPIVGRVLLL